MTQMSTLKVSIFQSAAGGARHDALAAALDAALTEAGSTDLLVCPELFLGGYGDGARTLAAAEPLGGPFMARVSGLAQRHGAAIAYGYPQREGEACYNAGVVIGADGVLLSNHRKQRLPNGYEKSCFSTGRGLSLFMLHGWRVALIICYEVEFPETVRQAALMGADLVIVPTALSTRWPIVPRAVIPTRAFENGVFLAYSNHGGTDGTLSYQGESCIIAPDGSELARAGMGAEVFSANLDPTAIAEQRGRIPFLADSAGLEASCQAR